MIAELSGLFAASFLAASLFPFQSELLFTALLLGGEHQAWLLLAAASLGNTFGSCLNWWLGRYMVYFQHKRWFPVKKAALAKAERWFDRYGASVLLLSWMPIIGDPLTVIAGVLRMNFLPFLLLVALAKTMRYTLFMLALLA